MARSESATAGQFYCLRFIFRPAVASTISFGVGIVTDPDGWNPNRPGTDRRFSQSGSRASDDPAVQRIKRAARGLGTDAGAGLYIHPDIDADRAANFIVSLQNNAIFTGVASTINDLLVFYDIDGSGEEGMAITRSNYLVNNNVSAKYDIGDLEEVRLKEGFFFWCEILVRERGKRRFELAGYAEKSPGRALASILRNMVAEDRA